MRTETEEIRDNLKYLSLLARDYPSQAAAASDNAVGFSPFSSWTKLRKRFSAVE